MLFFFSKFAWINGQSRLTSESIREKRFYAMLISDFAKFPAKTNLRVRQGYRIKMTTKSFLNCRQREISLSLLSPNCKMEKLDQKAKGTEQDLRS